MIFVTLGSQKFQFNRLLEAVDGLIAEGVITDEVFAQTGYSDYAPKHYAFKSFLDREEFARRIGQADIVITHGGTGSIIGAVKQGKKVIAAPRRAQYGEHVDDHQMQIVEQFAQMNLICGLKDVSDLEEALAYAANHSFQTYESNTDRMIESIEQFISGL